MEQTKHYDNVHGFCGHRVGTKSLNSGARVAPGLPEKPTLGRERSQQGEGSVCVPRMCMTGTERHPTQATGVPKAG